jgi:hypothetical protein
VWLEEAGVLQGAEVRSGGSYLSHNDLRVRFGLGRRTNVPPMKVRWPDGAVEWFEGLTANGLHVIRQGNGRAGAVAIRYAKRDHLY